MNFENERKELTCMIAFYVGTMDESMDYLSVMSACINKANDYEFPMIEQYGETVIDTGEVRDWAYSIANEFINELED